MISLPSYIWGEIFNKLVRDVAANVGIKLTAAYLPNQNGLNEQKQATVDLMMTGMREFDSMLFSEMA